MDDRLVNIIKDRPLVIPRYIFNNYKKLGLTEEELIVLIYLINVVGKIVYNPELFVNELHIEKFKAMEIMNNLAEKKMISFYLEKNNNISEEYISLELFYDHLSKIMLDKEEEVKLNTSIFFVFEQEFGRMLSPMEYEIIKGWINEKFDEELIKEALKEAIYNGVNNLRYIDKILYEWKKKNIKSKQEIMIEKEKFHRNSRKESKELFDYNWLDDE